MSPDEGKIKCKLCNYRGHPPVLRRHMYMAHGVDFGERYEKEK